MNNGHIQMIITLLHAWSQCVWIIQHIEAYIHTYNRDCKPYIYTSIMCGKPSKNYFSIILRTRRIATYAQTRRAVNDDVFCARSWWILFGCSHKSIVRSLYFKRYISFLFFLCVYWMIAVLWTCNCCRCELLFFLNHQLFQFRIYSFNTRWRVMSFLLYRRSNLLPKILKTHILCVRDERQMHCRQCARHRRGDTTTRGGYLNAL